MRVSLQENDNRLYIVKEMKLLSRSCQSIALFLTLLSASHAERGLQCSVQDVEQPDPALQVMEFDVGDGKQSTVVYVEPPIESFYQNQEIPARKKVTPLFDGFGVKFINMSNEPLTLYWYVQFICRERCSCCLLD